MSMAFAQCLGVPYKQNQAKISLYPCNKKSEFQKWECRNETLAIQGEDFFLSAGKKRENIVLKTGSETMNKWKIYETMDDLCSRGHEDLFTLLGNSNGAPCTFPFQLSGRWYVECTAAGRSDGLLWCATTPDFSVDHLYGFCPTANLIDSKRSSLWIGLNSLNLNSGWQWSGGIPFRYLNWAPGDAEPVKCPEGWLPYGDHCFMIHRNPKEWREALISCNESNGNLASIHSPEEHDFILSQLGYKAVDELWIGLNDLKTQMYFEWSDGTPVTYAKWLPGEPAHEVTGQENCVIMAGKDGYWADNACDRKLGYICRRDPLQGVSETTKTDPACLMDFVREEYQKKTWFEARDFCREIGGDLAAIRSEKEQTVIENLIKKQSPSSQPFWIGLQCLDPDGGLSWSDGSPILKNGKLDSYLIGLIQNADQQFSWMDGSPVHYAAWAQGEPSFAQAQENCVVLNKKDGLWNDVSCGFPNGYICERHRSFINATLPSEVPSPPGGCPADWLLFKNQCYKFFGSSYDYWITARRTCISLGGNLASIHNEQVQAFLTYHLKDVSNDPWIGLNDLLSELNFVWADGSAVSYTNWAPDSPKLVEHYLFDTLRPEDGHNLQQFDCVSLKRGPADDTGKWNDEECYKSRGFICQKNSDPALFQSSATVLDFASDHSSGISYSVTRFKMNWEEAHRSCNNNASELASILDPYSQALLFLLAQEYGEPLWIGLNSNMMNGKYQWIDRWRLVYSKWSSGEPKQTLACVYLDTDGTWKTASCKEKHFSVCKKSEGADLVSVEDYTEANFLANAIKILHGKSPNFWTGLKKNYRGWPIVKNGFAIFLENRSRGALERSRPNVTD
ncbi:hypothetical protein BTVI_60109 [Pitangus sulphuratus]|nr:hypothetical protein BTVI_60109 [Pitangus sulphuratus]